MQVENVDEVVSDILERNLSAESREWLMDKITFVKREKSTKDFYLTYTLIGSKVKSDGELKLDENTEITRYLKVQEANCIQIARIYLLVEVLNFDPAFFSPKVANIIQVADTSELETFLKFLILLPQPEKYCNTAVDALRTNIATIFNAITYNNPYPAKYFNEQQWNQMYLKTAFMQGDLSVIRDIDDRANKELARIIADYAHERWAASRQIDPYFWRPVTRFLDDGLLDDMNRLLQSDNSRENKAGALCCFYSENEKALMLLKEFPDLMKQIQDEKISWNAL